MTIDGPKMSFYGAILTITLIPHLILFLACTLAAFE
jgi:hypothetical protein